MKNINVVISAAGMGTRLGLDIPKCLISINGETLLARQLKQTARCAHVYVVVGFKERDVIEEAFKYRKDVIIVRNPMYATTSNAYSLSLGSRFCKSFLALDGDVWFPYKTMYEMLEYISENPGETVLFATPAKSQDTVFMNLNDSEDTCLSFSRTEETKHEWSGCGYYNNISIPQTARYVFEEIIPHLPKPAKVIKCWEVDTPSDLELLKNVKEETVDMNHTFSFSDIRSIHWIMGRGLVFAITPYNKDNKQKEVMKPGDTIRLVEHSLGINNFYTIRGVESWSGLPQFGLNVHATEKHYNNIIKIFQSWQEKH